MGTGSEISVTQSNSPWSIAWSSRSRTHHPGVSSYSFTLLRVKASYESVKLGRAGGVGLDQRLPRSERRPAPVPPVRVADPGREKG